MTPRQLFPSGLILPGGGGGEPGPPAGLGEPLIDHDFSTEGLPTDLCDPYRQMSGDGAWSDLKIAGGGLQIDGEDEGGLLSKAVCLNALHLVHFRSPSTVDASTRLVLFSRNDGDFPATSMGYNQTNGAIRVNDIIDGTFTARSFSNTNMVNSTDYWVAFLLLGVTMYAQLWNQNPRAGLATGSPVPLAHHVSWPAFGTGLGSAYPPDALLGAGVEGHVGLEMRQGTTRPTTPLTVFSWQAWALA